MRSNSVAIAHYKRGFTLIELSIVLVIIGLLIGGIITGRDMIEGATIRSQISQIESYKMAVNTFKLKYEALPGDLNSTTATRFGFAGRGANPGQGDGNSLIQTYPGAGTTASDAKCAGEVPLLWNDISYANGNNVNLINESFSWCNNGWANCHDTAPNINALFPKAKLGQGLNVYANAYLGKNYFIISKLVGAGGGNCGGDSQNSTGIRVIDAYQLDQKTDDGLPQSGKVTAQYSYGNNSIYYWAAGNNPWDGNPTPGSAASLGVRSCMDNGNNAADTMKYSTTNATSRNCALAFEF